MRIDRTHRSWLFASMIILAASTILYVPYALSSPPGPRGGSAMGLGFGIVGYGFMLFAGLLGARKNVPVWRVGRAQTWMRGHLWLGLLSLPLILFHGGFAWRGPLTATLMVLLFVVVASGLTGATLQHYLPKEMTSRVPLETIYEEIPHVRAQLLAEAETLVCSINGPTESMAALAVPTGATVTQAAVLTLVEIEQEEKARFWEVYTNTIKPFLEHPGDRGLALTDSNRSREVFESLRRILPISVHPVLSDLENICEEDRQLNRQSGLYQLLHGWLLIHVPTSIALLVLGGVHAFMALRY